MCRTVEFTIVITTSYIRCYFYYNTLTLIQTRTFEVSIVAKSVRDYNNGDRERETERERERFADSNC